MLSLLLLGMEYTKSIEVPASTIAAIVAASLLLGSRSTGSSADVRRTPTKPVEREVTSIRINLPKKASALTKRVAAILAGRILEYSGACTITSGKVDLHVYLAIEPGIGKEGFKICDRPGGGISITGNDERGLLYGVGKFLRTSSYSSR